MQRARLTAGRTLCLLAATASIAAVYSWTIFGNFCMDGDTLNWAVSFVPLEERMTFLSCIGIKEWFAKFHLLMFPLVYAFAKLYALRGGWDFLMGFKICTLACATLTVPLLFFIGAGAMRRFAVMLATSLIPLATLGYSWLITTCDDNPLANFFNLLFVASILVATGAIYPRVRERSPVRCAFLAGIMAGLSMGAHLKNIVALPLLLALVAVKPPAPRLRLRIAAAALGGFLLSFGLLYGIYWAQNPAEPLSSRIDFWVFHRVPGRFFLTPPHPPLRDHLVFALAGIRSSLCTFQELVIHTDLFDHDRFCPALIALFFGIYFAAALRMRERRAVKILFFLFLCDAGHSFLYDSWVVERWDSFTIPVYLTIGVYWDSVASGGRGGETRFRRARFSLLLLLFFAAIAWTNVRSTRLLIGITGNRLPYRKSEKTWWERRNKFYFYFDHRETYHMARQADSFMDGSTYFLAPQLVRGRPSCVYGVIDQYLTLYSLGYRARRIDDPGLIAPMVAAGRLAKILYLDRVEVPLYTGIARSPVIFDPSVVSTVFEGRQLTLKKAVFRAQKQVGR